MAGQMENNLWKQLLAWLSQPANYWVMLSVVLPLAVIPVAIWFARRGRRFAALNALHFFYFDADRRYVHFIGAHTYMPDGGDSFDVYHHRLLDRENGKIYHGGEQRGSRIHIDSNFILRTTATLEGIVGQKLHIIEKGSFTMDSENDKVGTRPLCIERPSFESDTEIPLPPPRSGIVFRQADSEKDHFSLEIYKDGQRSCSYSLPGSISAFKGLYDETKGELLFVYAHGMFYRLGIGIIEMSSGALKLQKLIKPDF